MANSKFEWIWMGFVRCQQTGANSACNCIVRIVIFIIFSLQHKRPAKAATSAEAPLEVQSWECNDSCHDHRIEIPKIHGRAALGGLLAFCQKRFQCQPKSFDPILWYVQMDPHCGFHTQFVCAPRTMAMIAGLTVEPQTAVRKHRSPLQVLSLCAANGTAHCAPLANPQLALRIEAPLQHRRWLHTIRRLNKLPHTHTRLCVEPLPVYIRLASGLHARLRFFFCCSFWALF